MAASERVKKLKLLIGGLEESTPRDFLSAPILSSGIPRGTIIELVGPCKTEWLIQFLKTQPHFRIFWAEQDQKILPTALHQRGLNLAQITFAKLGDDLVLPIRRVLQSQLYQVVIAPSHFTEIRILKAFQMFTEKSNALLFLMAEKEVSKAWPISMQLNIQKDPENQFKIEILRQKHKENFV